MLMLHIKSSIQRLRAAGIYSDGLLASLWRERRNHTSPCEMSSLITQFESWAVKTPEAKAVISGECSLSYRELANCSRKLAKDLIQAGVQRGDVVGLLFDRSIEWVVGVLAIIRTGAIYLPLPSDLPKKRRQLLIMESNARHGLSPMNQSTGAFETEITIDLAQLLQCRCSSVAETESTEHQGVEHDRACILFTSGSTGVPKGVVVRQSAILKLVVNTDYIQIQASDRIAFASHTAFDAVTFEVWGALLNGASLVVIQTSTLVSPRELGKAISSQGLTVFFITTEILRRTALGNPKAFGQLKWLIFGGERVEPESVRLIFESGEPPQQFIHAYGPTECTTFSTTHRIYKEAHNEQIVPIGKAIKGWQVHLLDESGALVQEGQHGEIFITGHGLAEGYLNNPAETDKAFQQITINGEKARAYRTGDIGQWNQGVLEFIGRKDHQIKVRGHRVELREITYALRREAAIDAAEAVTYKDIYGRLCIGACITLAKDYVHREAWELRDSYSREYPNWMRPTLWKIYTSLPLTPSGKIDRKLLSLEMEELDQQNRRKQDKAPIANQTLAEKKLALIWREVLGHFPSHPLENFFDAGGDSLQAVEIHDRIEKEWPIKVPPTLILEVPVFRQLAGRIESRALAQHRHVFWFRESFSRSTLACMPGAFGNVFFFRELLSYWPEEWGLCAMPSCYLKPSTFKTPLHITSIAQESVKRLEGENIKPIRALAGYSFGGLVAYEMACILARRGDPPPILVLYDSAAHGEEKRGRVYPDGAMPRWKRFAYRSRFIITRLLYRFLIARQWCLPGRLFEPAVANLVAVEQYHPLPYPGPMLLIRSSKAQAGDQLRDESLGWGSLVRGELTICSVSAGHNDFFRSPYIEDVAKLTIDYLTQNKF